MNWVWIFLSVLFTLFLFFISVLVIVKLYIKFITTWDTSATCLVGKTAIVTGANSGIGFYTAQDFAKRGARVILACRDPKRGEEAKARIIEATGNYNVVIKLIDFASLKSIRKFAIEIKTTEERLDILVNNAGATGFDHKMTEDGLSVTMQVNYFGPFLLTVLLIGLLKISSPSRIVNVSSALANVAKLNIDDLNAFPTGIFPKITDYNNTKLCNILFANELARRLTGTGVDVNSVHPGAVNTNILDNSPGIFKVIMKVIMKLYYKTPLEGAQTTIYVAVAKEISGMSGKYFEECHISKMPRKARDENLARKLWEKSVTFVKLTEEESQLVQINK